MPIKVAVSGGFDPIHVGHIEMLKEAKELGDYLVVIVNNDNWLKKKKGFAFMPEAERKAIVEAIRYVDEVVLTSHPPDPEDMSVCRELEKIHPQIFANGGDRDKSDAGKKTSSLNPEAALCESLGIKLVFNVGRSGKIQSSSELVKKALEHKK